MNCSIAHLGIEAFAGGKGGGASYSIRSMIVGILEHRLRIDGKGWTGFTEQLLHGAEIDGR